MEFLQTRDGMIYKGSEPFLIRGMGLGGWLLPEGYMWKFYTKCDRPRRMEALIEKLCGKEYAASFWKRYNSTFITEQNLAWISQQGLNSVRLALNSRHLFQMDERGDVRFCDKIIRHVDDCLRWCKKYGLYLFLDMHGAPGGQTGQNIDDSEADIPELFTKMENQDFLVQMWVLLAKRYAGEPHIGGYDLLNEPVTKWNSQYYDQVLPLYRRLIKAIRKVDPKHLIILEGVHWATDFSIFDPFTKEEAADQIVLEFHKYWNDPDEESLASFTEVSKRLRVPLWMGEGGENNLQWYTYVFPLYERLGIGWCFWSYKKMEVPNSPATFPQPRDWHLILEYFNGASAPDQQTSRRIFDDFLDCIAHTTYRPEIIDAMLRRPPIEIPAAAFDKEKIISKREPGVAFRKSSAATLLFADGRKGEADWRRYGGEPQPEEQKILLRLNQGDTVGYRIAATTTVVIRVNLHGNGILSLQGTPVKAQEACEVEMPVDGMVWLRCEQGTLYLENLVVSSKSNGTN